MTNPTWTHNNPFVQGGWDSEGSWPSSILFSPAPSSHSSGSSGGSDPSSQWVPAQSSFGVLPVMATPGALPPGLLGAITFRFMALGNQTNLSVTGPGNRICYRVRTSNTHSYITSPSGAVATVTWNGTETTIERGGRTLRVSDYLRDMRDAQHRRIKVVTIEGREFAWSFDDRGIYLHPNGNTGHVLCWIYNLNGVEFKVLGDGLSTEMLINLVLAVVLMQGRMFVGLR
ncbi:hypothetical protein DFH11DRAFT_701233 [Phellopilus nigrolimitatus]|nr:hypothetical protein DFH11DRAFT_701233 [Phellopilus nigrolimitatus]